MRGLTVPELAERVGESAERLHEWRSLGLLRGEDDGFAAEDVHRARLVQLLLRRGIDLATIVRANDDEAVLTRYVELAFPNGIGASCSVEEAAERVGLDVETVRRFWNAWGPSDEDEVLYEDDVRALEGLKVALDVGLSDDVLLQLGRVYTDALGRVADAETRLTHFFVHERMRAQGLGKQQLIDADRMASARLMPLTEPMVRYFHHRGRARALRDDLVMHVEEHAGVRQRPAVPGQLRMAIMFVDLAGFTSLADAMGDETAAAILERFSQMVRDAARTFEGHVVKQIGDAFLLVFADAPAAVSCALEIERRSLVEAHFPAVRTGLHHGQVLYREGDYLGTTVNVAARLAAEASRHQVLVTAAVRQQAAGLADVEFLPLGARRLRGLAEELEVFSTTVRREPKGPERQVDPVCGMELRVEEIAARLSLAGRERAFCSQRCLQRFVAAPQQYGAA
jgi:class 3 adenylate cyclase/YHS domain-containing protein